MGLPPLGSSKISLIREDTPTLVEQTGESSFYTKTF